MIVILATTTNLIVVGGNPNNIPNVDTETPPAVASIGGVGGRIKTTNSITSTW